MDFRKMIGFRVSTLVDGHGGQRRLAHKAGINSSVVSRMVSGHNLTIENLAAVASACHVPMKYFFEEDDREAEYLIRPDSRPEEEKELLPSWEDVAQRDRQIKQLTEDFEFAKRGAAKLNSQLNEKEFLLTKMKEERDRFAAEAKKDIPNAKELAKALIKAANDILEAI